MPDGKMIEILRWWERKRLLYTIIVVLAETFVLLLLRKNLELMDGWEVAQIVLSFPILANLAYTSGWVCEILLWYYLRISPFNSAVRRTLFVSGSIFFVLLTWANFLYLFRTN